MEGSRGQPNSPVSAFAAILNTGANEAVDCILEQVASNSATGVSALVGFGVVLGVLAMRTGRLGPGIFAHLSFNAATVVALAVIIYQPNPQTPSFGSLPFYYLILGATVLLGALMWGLLRSPWGKAFTALRDNPIRAESLGINVQAYTLLAFAIGAMYAGIAGALFASLVDLDRKSVV